MREKIYGYVRYERKYRMSFTPDSAHYTSNRFFENAVGDRLDWYNGFGPPLRCYSDETCRSAEIMFRNANPGIRLRSLDRVFVYEGDEE